MKTILRTEFTPKCFNLVIFFDNFRNIRYGFYCSHDFDLVVMEQRGILKHLNISAVFSGKGTPAHIELAGFKQNAPMIARAFKSNFTDITV